MHHAGILKTGRLLLLQPCRSFGMVVKKTRFLVLVSKFLLLLDPSVYNGCCLLNRVFNFGKTGDIFKNSCVLGVFVVLPLIQIDFWFYNTFLHAVFFHTTVVSFQYFHSTLQNKNTQKEKKEQHSID